MKKILQYITLPVAALLGYLTASAQRPQKLNHMKAPVSIYSYQVMNIKGELVDFKDFRNKKILIVNTASRCGKTPQYADLQKLHEQYGDKVVVLGFPSNNFGAQEPLGDTEIAQFCTVNYGVTFPMFHKMDVKGEEKAALYQWLTDPAKNGWNDQEPTWNFCKYLIDENGELLSFFPSNVNPLDDQIISLIK